MGAKKGIYGIITAFFVLMIAVFVFLSLTQVVSLATLFKVHTADDAKKDLAALGVRKMVRSCLGTIIDISRNDSSCLGSIHQGVVISVMNDTGCKAMNVTILPPAEHGIVEVYNQPVYQNKTIICPGRLQIYT
jgi:hypothetical protein